MVAAAVVTAAVVVAAVAVAEVELVMEAVEEAAAA